MHFKRLLILALLFSMPASAAYKWTMPDGSVIFSDQPPHPDAEKITLTPTQTFTAPPITAKASDQKADTEAKPAPSYSSLLITQPANDESIFDNTGNIAVAFSSEPPLLSSEGHQISVKLDGTIVATTTAAQVLLPNVDRGSHTLRVAIVDKAGAELITSDESIFHLRRTSILHPKPGAPN